MKMEHAVVTPLAGTVTRVAGRGRPAGAARRPAGGGIGLRWPTDEPPEVRIYEVGPRDGLQAEAAVVPTDAKLAFIGMLADAGLREIEATSLVSPKAIPQLADADELLRPSSGGPASATRSWCRTSAAWSAPSPPAWMRSASSPRRPRPTCSTTSG